MHGPTNIKFLVFMKKCQKRGSNFEHSCPHLLKRSVKFANCKLIK